MWLRRGVVKEVRGVAEEWLRRLGVWLRWAWLRRLGVWLGRGVAKGLGVWLGRGVVMEVRGVAEKESRFRGRWCAENVGQGEGGKFQARECKVNMARSLPR